MIGSQDSRNLFSAIASQKAANTKITLGKMMLRRRPVEVNFDHLDSVARGKSKVLLLNLFDDVTLSVIIERLIIRSTRNYSIIGSIDEENFGSFILTVNKNVVVGNIRTRDGRHYQVQYSKDGNHETRSTAGIPSIGRSVASL